ncbi:MAG TPA: protein kinase, partial [Pleomorphomonadaceae bacterium]|nr:protein kinase [Pleomorphomonadaceae bacterium]
RDVARALADAHQHGVIHRDIKPENILLSGDAAMVTDFGIAKALAVAREAGDSGAAETTGVTATGVMMGTPTYAAPEQITGDTTIDHRADLYSFGCLAYELLTGAPPFQASSPQALLADHVLRQPTPVSERCHSCPPDLARLVMGCLEKEPARRPESARQVLEELERGYHPAGPLRQLQQRLAPQRLVVRWGLLLGTLGLVAAVLVFRGSAGIEAEVPGVAVLPFVDLRADSAGAYLADGLADGLATALGKVQGIRVVSRSLSYRYRDRRELDAREVGRELGAGFLVRGSVRDLGSALRVSAQLISTADNREVWAEMFDGRSEDALVIQDAVTRALMSALPRGLGLAATDLTAASASAPGTTNPEAYDLYLRGRFLLLRRGPGVQLAIQNFESAIAADSAFAAAHAGLALALQLLPYFAAVSAAEVRDRSIGAAQRALRRDSTLVEAHIALAMAHQHDWRWREAEAAYRHALTLEADEPDLHIQFGRFLTYTGQYRAALAEFERARALDPYSAVASAWVGYVSRLTGLHERGLVEVLRALEIDSTNPPALTMAIDALADDGRAAEARALADRLWATTPTWRSVAAAALARLGEPGRARGMLRELENDEPASPLVHTRRSLLHLALGEADQALGALELAVAGREILPTFVSLGVPEFDLIRHDPRFAEIVRRLGLDDRNFTLPRGGRER